MLKCPITCSIYFDNKAKPVLSTVILLLLNSVIVRLLLKYLISLFPNCQNFSSQFCHYSTASLLCMYTSLHTALTSKPALTCIHSPFNAMLVPIALVLPRFNSTQLKFCHFVHYFQRQVVLVVALHLFPYRAYVLPNLLKLTVDYKREYHPACELLGHNILRLDSLDSKLNHQILLNECNSIFYNAYNNGCISGHQKQSSNRMCSIELLMIPLLIEAQLEYR